MKRWLLAVSCFIPVSITAQQDSLLREAVRLATEGQSAEASEIVRARLREAGTSSALYPEVLYTAGLIAEHADSARSYFRRVTSEYSNSAWADRSLLRIAQLAYGMGDFEISQRSAERVLIDYPFSDVRAGAAFLLARLHLDRREVEQGCQYLSQATEESGNDVELANQAAFYIQRCENVVATPPPPASEDPPPSGGQVTFSVQVTAVSSAAAADELMRALVREGFTAEVIRDGGLFKVRVGRFSRRGDADSLRDQIRSRVGGEPFVVENR